MEKGISKDVYIDDTVTIGKNVTIEKNAIINPNVIIGDNTFIGSFCIIGEHTAEYYKTEEYNPKPTIIGANSVIRSHTIIYEDVTIGDYFNTGHHVTIREKTIVGKMCSIGTLSDLQGEINIGDYVRLHSNVHIGQKTNIEDYVWIYPYVVTTNDPYPPMGKLLGSKICKYSQIATGAIILPGMTIGENSLVGAGSLVTKDVPKEVVVMGVPAKLFCPIHDIRDKEGNPVYPWKEYLKDYRGYPWQ